MILAETLNNIPNPQQAKHEDIEQMPGLAIKM
jgi:hypothetical protein